MLLTIIAGARPNFMKIAPIIRAIKTSNQQNKEITYRLIHTGQHYDKLMSGDFFEQLGIPEPNKNLGAGGGTQAEQTASIMVRFEKELEEHRPDVVLVVGDVTSTMACAITAKKMCVDVVHVEAGIRSGDMTMPEEINRILTDAICNHYFTTSKVANENLKNTGVSPDKIHFVGNTMIDTLYENITKLKQPKIWESLGLKVNGYFLVTLHRPSNVDSYSDLGLLLDSILDNSLPYPVIFPVHPRTKKSIDKLGYKNPRLIQIDPLSYLEFVFLLKNAMGVITDSGGITEETTVLGVPCLTLRNSTERPETISIGTNELVGTNPNDIAPYLEKIVKGQWKKGSIPNLWDGKTSIRIVEKLRTFYP